MKKLPTTLKAFTFVCILVLLACSQKRPVFYPNSHLEQVGDEVAQADIDECILLAADHGAGSSASGKVAKQTAGSAAVGAAAGAATGAVLGSAGRGAAVGAAGAAAGSCLGGILRSREPDPVKQRFVERCLVEKGYAPIGWR